MNGNPGRAGRVVIVTGGTRGVGRGISQAFLDDGAEVVTWARRPPDAPIVSADGARTASYREVDLRDADATAAAVDAVVEELGRIDVFVNNAGGSPPADSATASPRFTTSIVNLNLIVPLVCAQQANAVMQAQDDGGSIINIASVSAIRPSPNTVAYGAAKAGLVNATTTLAVEWAPKVRVNAVIAGLVETEQSHLFYGDDDGVAAVGRTIPVGRMAVPGDIGNACVFLASDAASYVNGSALLVHGGGELPAYLDAAKTTGD